MSLYVVCEVCGYTWQVSSTDEEAIRDLYQREGDPVQDDPAELDGLCSWHKTGHPDFIRIKSLRQ